MTGSTPLKWIPHCLIGAISLASWGCGFAHPTKVRPLLREVGTSKWAPWRLPLTPEQSKAAVLNKSFVLAEADFGYHIDANVAVAELTEGSGIAYVTWVVLRKTDKGWVTRETSRTHVQENIKEILITDSGSRRTFRVNWTNHKKSVVLELP